MRTKRTAFLIALAALAAVIFVLNKVASDHFYYWIYWWYDLMMHFLGGCLIGGLAAWGVVYVRPTISPQRALSAIVIAIAAVGIGWEVFEYLTGQYVGQAAIVMDTATDLLMDLLGALILGSGIYMALRSRPESNASSL
jgi:hypothetical protein